MLGAGSEPPVLGILSRQLLSVNATMHRLAGADVWQARVPDLAARRRHLESMLSGEELARCERLRSEVLRERFVAAHGFVRSVLSGYLGMSGGDLSFGRGPFGKPHVIGSAGAGLDFSLSHAGDLVCCAVSRGRPVGVDVERVRHVADVDRLAERVMSEPERRRLLEVDEAERDRAFLTAWVAKEACLKAAGLGLAGDPRRVEVAPDGAGGVRLERAGADEWSARRWSLVTVATPEGHVGALAVGVEEVQPAQAR